MATTLYNRQIEAFYREVGEGNVVVVNAASSSTLTKNAVPYTPKRWSLDLVYDIFWRAGITLYRVLEGMDFEKIRRQMPSFFAKEEITLTTGVGDIANDYVFIYEQGIALKTAIWYPCKKIPEDQLIQTINLTAGSRKAPSATSPKFSVSKNAGDNKITVYPIATAFEKIQVQGVLTVQRLIAATNNFDSWNENFSDLLIDGAIFLAKMGTGDAGVASLYQKNLQMSYGLIARKPTKLNNSQIEEEK